MVDQGDRVLSKKSEMLIVFATKASVFVAFILLIVKYYAWFETGSIGVLAALVDSLLDLGASLINMFAVRYALIPADDEHKFGHGKAEALAGLGQALFIVSSAVFLIIYTFERIINPKQLESFDIGLSIIVFSMALTFILVAYQRYVVKLTGSIAVKADSVHYSTDLISNAGILVGLGLAYLGWIYSDPIIGLLIGVYILKSALEIGYESVQLLIDRELPEEEQQLIHKLATKHSDVIEVHDVRTRQSGHTKFIQLHLVLDGGLTLLEAHVVSDEVERNIRKEFQYADILIHQDPHTESSTH
ncbi:MAG: ferrous-iron efflux pump FieF [Oleiphilaceae bacterium]|jgi:ferrous-iron efflux pump FieF